LRSLLERIFRALAIFKRASHQTGRRRRFSVSIIILERKWSRIFLFYDSEMNSSALPGTATTSITYRYEREAS
jgi:hypothetical protein